jgi:hypothetical protein
VILHIWKYVSSKKLREAQALADEEHAHPSMVKSLQNQETAGMESDRDIETASGGSNADDVSTNIETEVGVVKEEEA